MGICFAEVVLFATAAIVSAGVVMVPVAVAGAAVVRVCRAVVLVLVGDNDWLQATETSKSPRKKLMEMMFNLTILMHLLCLYQDSFSSGRHMII
jgi:hypothetical protein